MNLTEAIKASVEGAVSTALLAKSGNGPTMLKENLLNVKVVQTLSQLVVVDHTHLLALGNKFSLAVK